MYVSVCQWHIARTAGPDTAGPSKRLKPKLRGRGVQIEMNSSERIFAATIDWMAPAFINQVLWPGLWK